MIPSSSKNLQRPGPVQRYGPLTGIIVAIALVSVLVTVTGKRDVTQVAANGRSSEASRGENASKDPSVPINYEQAQKEGKENSTQWVDNCDPTTGKIKMPSVYAPPCVPKFTGDNGGTTAPGVTADTITVVYYLPSLTGDVLSTLAGKLDDPENVRTTASKYVEMMNGVAELYGRKVDLKFFQSEASGNNPVPYRAEATKIIEDFHPFASINGPALTPAYSEELAAQGVLCLGCGVSTSDTTYQNLAPHMWGTQSSPDEYLQTMTEYIRERLVNRPAKFAGDAALQKKNRTIGIVHFEQDPPVFNDLEDVGTACEKVTGWKAEVTEIYFLTNMTDRAPIIISKLKAAGITTVFFLGDPVMPAILTKEATKQGYFPEWLIAGTVLTDTAAAARLYDPEQWKHAYGLAQLPVPVPQKQREAWTLHEWYFGAPPAADKTNALIWSNIQQLFGGLHAAGPKLNPETFKQGMFNLPEVGGTPTAARISYGDHGYFKKYSATDCSLGAPRVDYQAIDDMVELWWDSTIEGPDEQGKTDVKGKYRYANGGKRYAPNQMPKTETDAFKKEGSVIEFETIPKQERAPDYPKPAKK